MHQNIFIRAFLMLFEQRWRLEDYWPNAHTHESVGSLGGVGWGRGTWRWLLVVLSCYWSIRGEPFASTPSLTRTRKRRDERRERGNYRSI